MARRSSPLRKLLSPGRIFIPVGLGVGVAAWLLISNFDRDALLSVNWTWNSSFWLFMALVMMAIRDLAYMLRLRILTGKSLSWRKLFDVIFLWEFASSVTPSVVGGAPIAIFILNRENISLGKSTTLVLITSLLDELFFIVMVPVLCLLLAGLPVFPSEGHFSVYAVASGARIAFWTSYSLILLYCCFIFYGIFLQPEGLKRIIVMVFRLPVLNRWVSFAERTGNEILTAAGEVKQLSIMQWAKASGATFLSWTARYWVVNCILMSFAAVDNHLLVYARQMIMWIVMLISPTPGSSGVAEYAFAQYLSDFIPYGLNSSLAFLWRLISYYPYLFIGAVILPGWIRRVYLKRKLITFRSR